MKKLWNTLRNNILSVTLIGTMMFICCNFIMKQFAIQFRQWILYSVAFFAIIGTVVGLVQVTKRVHITNTYESKPMNEGLKSLLMFLLVIVIMINGLFYYAFLYEPEHVVVRDGKKYIAHEVTVFDTSDVYYYDYISPIVMGGKIRIEEHYDGFFHVDGSVQPQICIYYDKDGNVVKKSYKEQDSKFVQKEEPQTADRKDNTDTAPHSEVLYEKKIDDKTSIRVVLKGTALGEKDIIIIEKTMDGGISWQQQDGEQGTGISVATESEYVFLNENTGFINEHGYTASDGERRGLIVTMDGGRTFSGAIVKPGDTYCIEGVPYNEGDVIKVKAYFMKNNQRQYCELISTDGGFVWEPLRN